MDEFIVRKAEILSNLIFTTNINKFSKRINTVIKIKSPR
jgi:hypothetical protein